MAIDFASKLKSAQTGKAVSSAPAASSTAWHDAWGDCPEPEQDVLVIVDGSIHFGRYIGGDGIGTTYWEADGVGYPADVDWWMPLPDLPGSPQP